MSISEKRKYSRLNKHFSLDCQRRNNFSTQENSKTKNISVGGLLFYSKKSYSKKEILNLKIYIPHFKKYSSTFYKPEELSYEKPLELIACVKRCQKEQPGNLYDVAVSFDGIDDTDQWTLTKYIKSTNTIGGS